MDIERQLIVYFMNVVSCFSMQKSVQEGYHKQKWTNLWIMQGSKYMHDCEMEEMLIKI